MRVGFLLNQIDGRGTGNAVFNYAHYNEEILGNASKIFTLPNANHNTSMVDIFVNRFENIFVPSPHNLVDVDILYHIKSGERDEHLHAWGNLPYAVHAVFNVEPHGDRYATISEWMSLEKQTEFVPHIIKHPEDAEADLGLRKAIGIPENDIVFGRIGGYDTFDIPWAWDAIKKVLDLKDNVWFLFVNTHPGIQHERVIFYPETLNPFVKKAFIMTCNAMLHARARGETFGISVGEFSSLGRPIFTYGKSYEKAHYYELKGTAKRYNDKEELVNMLLEYKGEPAHPFYTKYTPERVMEKFKEVFLD